MDAKQVVGKILSDARAEADKIKAQAMEKEQAEKAGLDRELEEYNKQTELLAEKAAKDKRAHMLAAARMDIAKEYLAEKGKIFNEVFKQARKQLQNLPDDKYCQLMSKLMLEAVETGDEQVIVDKKESRINQRFIEKINQQLASGSKGNLKLAEERQDIGGGFILRRGKIKNNVSLKVLLEQARKELESELAKELFGN